MEKRKQPKYKIGDTVVIIIYGTVGKVTQVKWLNGMYMYEINKGEGLYLESSILPLEDYEGKLLEKEHIDIEYKFFFGDLVQVKGYGPDLFKVVGFRTEIWRYKEDAWEDIIYELSRIRDGEWLEAAEDEMKLVADSDSAEVFIQKLGLLYSSKGKSLPPPKKGGKGEVDSHAKDPKVMQKNTQHDKLIDSLLDLYNDYQILYRWFGDEEYGHVLQAVKRKLASIISDGQSAS